MVKGIILFDIKDFLYQGQDKQNPDIGLINQKQVQTLNILHRKLGEERQRRINSNIPVPVVDIFLPTGDGYFLLCTPALATILDISQCIMALMKTSGIDAYCVAHLGDVNIFTDMTGKENATGFELGYCARLQSICKDTGKLICSKDLVNKWRENDYYRLQEEWYKATAKDGISYTWKLADPIDFEKACGKFSEKIPAENQD